VFKRQAELGGKLSLIICVMLSDVKHLYLYLRERFQLLFVDVVWLKRLVPICGCVPN